MASLAEVAEKAKVDGPALVHLQRLVSSWGLLADLSFADLLLFAPAAHDDESLVILDQIRPTTSQTLYREDQIGRIVSADDRPHVARAWALGEIIHGELRLTVRGEVASIECIPVRLQDRLIGIMTRDAAPLVGRRPGELEQVYKEIFDRFAGMVAAGDFPFADDDADADEVHRVGDGVARLDRSQRVDFASPNFVSALHRMGVHVNVQGARLGEVGLDDSAVRAAFKAARPMTREIERGEVTVLVRCIPLLDRGTITGAVAMMRDVSELRRRDRLLMSKDMTIREIHHRVKNNLQTVSSLLRLQGRRLSSAEARSALEAAEARIRSIALVHETLSATGATEQVAFDEIVRPLVRLVEEGLLAPERRLVMRVEGNAGDLPAEVATPLAVVLTELLQNAVRHGYPEDDRRTGGGMVRVVLDRNPDALTVEVVDDGVGLPKSFPAAETSLGLTIVRTLVRELRGTIGMASTGPGTTVSLRVPLDARPRAARGLSEGAGSRPAAAASGEAGGAGPTGEAGRVGAAG